MKSIARIARALINRSKRSARLFLESNYATVSYSQYGEDMLIRSIFARFPSNYHGFYVDVGAHHPKRFSNTCYFFNRGWHGISIDPIPGGADLFSKARPKDVFLEAGVSENENELNYYMYEDHALNTFSEETVKNRPNHVLQIRKVKTLPLAKIFDEYLPKDQVIDFLSIDTEGFELSVVRSNDWKRYRPRVVVLEDMSKISLNDVPGMEIDVFMNQREYRMTAWTPSSLIYLDKTCPCYDGGAFLNYKG